MARLPADTKATKAAARREGDLTKSFEDPPKIPNQFAGLLPRRAASP
jgi:hypothetical protein